MNCSQFMSSLACSSMFVFATSHSYLIRLENALKPSFFPCIRLLNSVLTAARLWNGISRRFSSASILPSVGSAKPSISSLNCAGILVNSSSAQLVKLVGSTILACSSSHPPVGIYNPSKMFPPVHSTPVVT